MAIQRLIPKTTSTASVKSPVDAVYKQVRPVNGRSLTYHGVEEVHAKPLTYQQVNQTQNNVQQQNAISIDGSQIALRKAEKVASRDLAYDLVHSREGNRELTLQELFSGQEG